MTDATHNNATLAATKPSNSSISNTPSTNTKPRLSLLSSSKQTGIRINSDDQPDQHPTITILSGTHEDFVNVHSNPEKIENNLVQKTDNEVKKMQENPTTTTTSNNNNSQQANVAQNVVRNNLFDESNRMNISKEDLIRLLSMLKTELQSKEIALAAIKCEQLKRLINPVEISRSSLANTYIELQDRIKICDKNNNNKQDETNTTTNTKSASKNSNLEANQRNDSSKDIVGNETKENDLDDQESLNILNTLLELLDRHPLLALPRDSIYCLDYNCNELSTKNYLNLKIQHLDNLINQHRRYRYYMNERLKKSEQRYLDLTHQLELERLLKSEIEKSAYKATGRATLLKHIDELKEALEKEKSDKQVIVMTLLNELLDERERSQKLLDKINELELIKNNGSSMSAQDEKLYINENREKIQKFEADLSELNLQLRKQTMSSIKEKNEMALRNSELTSENQALRSRLEQQEAKLVALMKTSISSAHNNNTKSKPQTVSPSSPSRNGSKQVIPTGNKATSNSPIAPTVAARSSIGSAKSSPPAKAPSTAISLSQRGSSLEGVQSQQIVAGPSKPASSQKSSAPPIAMRTLANNSSGNESMTPRLQPLFKPTTVMSSMQQTKNLKSSTSTGGISSNSNSNSSSLSSAIGPARGQSTNNQTVTKPRVPAKPAQLLDQQRNSVN